jgi:hypothetical protein
MLAYAVCALSFALATLSRVGSRLFCLAGSVNLTSLMMQRTGKVTVWARDFLGRRCFPEFGGRLLS